jgi:hypothetical protein
MHDPGELPRQVGEQIDLTTNWLNGVVRDHSDSGCGRLHVAEDSAAAVVPHVRRSAQLSGYP